MVDLPLNSCAEIRLGQRFCGGVINRQDAIVLLHGECPDATAIPLLCVLAEGVRLREGLMLLSPTCVALWQETANLLFFWVIRGHVRKNHVSLPLHVL